MMKKILLIFGVLFLYFPNICKAIEPYNRSQPDQVGYFSTEKSTYIFRVDYDGNLLPGRNEFSDIGQSTGAYKRAFFGSINVASGIVNVVDKFTDVPGDNTTSYISITISTSTLINGSTTSITKDLAQPKYARNLVISASVQFLVSSAIITGACTFYGISNLGVSGYERIALSTNETVGSIAWATISSFTVNATSFSQVSQSDALLRIGTTNSIGLSNIVLSTGDIYKLIEMGVNNAVDSSVTVDTTNSTIRFQNAPTSDSTRDYEVWYINRRSRR